MDGRRVTADQRTREYVSPQQLLFFRFNAVSRVETGDKCKYHVTADDRIPIDLLVQKEAVPHSRKTAEVQRNGKWSCCEGKAAGREGEQTDGPRTIHFGELSDHFDNLQPITAAGASGSRRVQQPGDPAGPLTACHKQAPLDPILAARMRGRSSSWAGALLGLSDDGRRPCVDCSPEVGSCHFSCFRVERGIGSAMRAFSSQERSSEQAVTGPDT